MWPCECSRQRKLCTKTNPKTLSVVCLASCLPIIYKSATKNLRLGTSFQRDAQCPRLKRFCKVSDAVHQIGHQASPWRCSCPIVSHCALLVRMLRTSLCPSLLEMVCVCLRNYNQTSIFCIFWLLVVEQSSLFLVQNTKSLVKLPLSFWSRS